MAEKHGWLKLEEGAGAAMRVPEPKLLQQNRLLQVLCSSLKMAVDPLPPESLLLRLGGGVGKPMVPEPGRLGHPGHKPQAASGHGPGETAPGNQGQALACIMTSIWSAWPFLAKEHLWRA